MESERCHVFLEEGKAKGDPQKPGGAPSSACEKLGGCEPWPGETRVAVLWEKKRKPRGLTLEGRGPDTGSPQAVRLPSLRAALSLELLQSQTHGRFRLKAPRRLGGCQRWRGVAPFCGPLAAVIPAAREGHGSSRLPVCPSAQPGAPGSALLWDLRLQGALSFLPSPASATWL